MFVIIITWLLFVVNTTWASKTYRIKETKEVYPLDWETIYTVNISNGYSTVIEPPEGYVLTDAILGDSKAFQSGRTENRLFLKRVAPDYVSSNLILILTSPDKTSRSLTFELTGYDYPKVSNVQFITPERIGANPELEAMRDFYTTQLQLSLKEQEKTLNSMVREKTMEKIETFHVVDRDPSTEKLGARIRIEAVLNSGGKGYVYVFTNAKDPDFQVVRLTGIQSKDIGKTVQLFRTQKLDDGTRYIYETTPFAKTDEGKKYAFFFRVYQEKAEIETKVK